MTYMKKKKFYKRKCKDKKEVFTPLEKINIGSFMEDYAIMGKFCNLPQSKKEWIEITRYELQGKANRYEQLMGEYLIKKKIKFIHQAPFVIDGKIYFLDFFLPDKRVAIELDGNYHLGFGQSFSDNNRDKAFSSIGIKTIRLLNAEVLDKNQIKIRLSET